MVPSSIKNSFFSFCVFILVFLTNQDCFAWQKVKLTFNPNDPRISFAVKDLKKALLDTGHRIVQSDEDKHIIFDLFTPGMGPQAFRIRRESGNTIRVIGGDALGAMYGGLELAEMISLNKGLNSVREKARKPYIFRRGLKFNIPLGARAPSYDDTGTSAQKNIPVMWDFDFWQDFLDTMARFRYNLLTLWTTHPYPSWVKLDKYPGINYDDVCVLKKPIDENSDRHWKSLDMHDQAHFKVVKKISLKEKITFWNRVFDYAQARGIEIYIFHWNIYTFGARGRHGIDDMPDNQKTIEYMRYCISEFLKTYPQIDGIGVTAGENVNRKRARKIGGIEKWLWQTYGQGVMDAKAENPGREIRFIFRQHQARLTRIKKAFKEFDGSFNTGHKYARARLYSTTTSPYLDFEYRKHLEKQRVPCWLNLRNDDLYIHRWGDADYVREFLMNVPRDLMRFEAGFYMGPDGYVFGRDFASKEPGPKKNLELCKHWYRYMLWGRLGYDPSLTRAFFEQILKNHFSTPSPALLYDTWAAASQIIPQVNRFFFRVNDIQFSPEGCVDEYGFLSLKQFFKHPPLKGSGILSVKDYAKARVQKKAMNKTTPMDAADNLDHLAQKTFKGIKTLRETKPKPGKELKKTLIDMESMAYLGRYYADKIRGAAELAVFQADPENKESLLSSIKHLSNAVKEWEAYSQIAASQYHPQLFSRTHYMDWWKTLEDVKNELETIRKIK